MAMTSAIRGRKVAAPLKAGQGPCQHHRAAAIRGRKVAAPLKDHDTRVMTYEATVYPRPEGRGPIEGFP